jgi:uncharacterized membrane protein YcaP (DUF421 family)
MTHDLFHLQVPGFELILRAAVVYVAVLVLLRLSGKRQVGQMGPTEFVAILLISNAVQNAMNGGDNSLMGGLILAVALIALSAVISFLTFKNRTFRGLFEGTPRLLIHNGAPVEQNLHRELISTGELHTLLRRQGIHQVKDVRSAVLESDGTLSIIRESDLQG